MDWNKYPNIGSTHGTRLGIHTQGSDRAAYFMRQSIAAGVRFGLVKSLGPNILSDFRQYSPETVRVFRVLLHHPVDPLNDLLNPDLDPAGLVRYAIARVVDEKSKLAHPDDADFFEIFNECDFTNPDGSRSYDVAWAKAANIFKACAEQATALGIHLAVGGLADGTPEYSEMQAMKATGLFDALRAGRHALSVHEGVYDSGAAIESGYGDLIPGAPGLPADGGSLCGRFRYWGDPGVPIIVSEMYLSGPGADYNAEEYTRRVAWYDALCRRYPYVAGFAPFTLDPAGGHTSDGVDYEKYYQKFIEYMQTIKYVANAAPVSPDAGLYRVAVPAALMRGGPGQNYPVYWFLLYGAHFRAVGSSGKWLVNRSGKWMHKSSLRRVVN